VTAYQHKNIFDVLYAIEKLLLFFAPQEPVSVDRRQGFVGRVEFFGQEISLHQSLDRVE
jgi:hypothetical protein